MTGLYIAFSTFVSVELLSRLPLACNLQRAVSTARKAGAVLKSRRISDDWKERLLRSYALRIATSSALMFLCLLISLSPFLLLGVLLKGDVIALMLRLDVLIGVTALAMGYLAMKRIAQCLITP